MRGRLALAAAILASAACTKTNPNFCADAGRDLLFSCSALDAARHDVRDASGDGGDAGDAVDAAKESAPEAKGPVCVTDNECAASADAGTPACGTRDGGAACVECTSSSHCKSTKPVCDSVAEKCVECLGTEGASGTECKADSKRSVCNKMTQSCVGCVDNTNCAPATPICDGTLKSCRTCVSDTECTGIGPGICVDWDGHCATNAEVAFLDRGGSCEGPQSQYCTSSTAVSALTPQKTIVLITGSMPVSAVTITGVAPSPVLIVGRGAASVGAGAGDAAGIAIDGVRKVWVRDLKISGGTAGILVMAGAELHLTRAKIVGNAAGGIQTKSSSFDITNTIIAMNGQGDSTGGISWAGARLGDIPASGISRFENNTVVGNLSLGVSCAAAYPILGSIVHGNTAPQLTGCMAAAPCCGATDPDPGLDASYHLMSGSPCIDKIPATGMTLTTDIDQRPRPAPPGSLDCGADEFTP